MRYGWLVLIAVGLAAVFSSGTDAQTKREYRVKAAYIYKFPKYVQWPKKAAVAAAPVLKIGVLGKDPFGNFDTIKMKKVGGRKIVIKRSTELKDMLDCQILFISTSEKDRLETLFPVTAKNHILTIGESKAFARRGGIIRLYRKGKKIRLEINIDAAKKSRLQLDAKLLKLARIVRSPKKK